MVNTMAIAGIILVLLVLMMEIPVLFVLMKEMQMGDIMTIVGIILVPFVLWYIVKRMIYSVVYVAKKAAEDAKNNSRNNE